MCPGFCPGHYQWGGAGLINFIKKIAFLTPRFDLGNDAFMNYWEHTHGPLVGSSTGYSEWRWRYVQNHPVGPGPGGGPFAFLGIAEFWLPLRAPSEEEYVSSSIYRDRIAVDEDQFIDKKATLSLRAHEQVLLNGDGPIKIMRFGTYSKYNAETVLKALLEDLKSECQAAELRGWRVDHVISGSTRLPGAEAATGLDFDYVESLYFDSVCDAEKYMQAAEFIRATILDGQATSLYVRERVFLKNGVFQG